MTIAIQRSSPDPRDYVPDDKWHEAASLTSIPDCRDCAYSAIDCGTVVCAVPGGDNRAARLMRSNQLQCGPAARLFSPKVHGFFARLWIAIAFVLGRDQARVTGKSAEPTKTTHSADMPDWR